MVETTTIEIKKSTQKKLMKIKYDLFYDAHKRSKKKQEFKSMDQVINFLIKILRGGQNG